MSSRLTVGERISVAVMFLGIVLVLVGGVGSAMSTQSATSDAVSNLSTAIDTGSGFSSALKATTSDMAQGAARAAWLSVVYYAGQAAVLAGAVVFWVAGRLHDRERESSS